MYKYLMIALLVLFVISLLLPIIKDSKSCSREGIGGFGVTSAISLYNTGGAYCREPDNKRGFSGGCFSPSTVII